MLARKALPNKDQLVRCLQYSLEQHYFIMLDMQRKHDMVRNKRDMCLPYEER